MRNLVLVIAIYIAGASTNVHALSNDVPPWMKFDEYSEISQESEQQRLKAFIFQLRASPGHIAIIVAYGGETTCPNEAQSRANRVRHLLLRSGVRAQRIRVVDAGYQRQWTISLFIGQPDSPPLTAQSLNSFDGHIDPSRAKMLRSCRGLKSKAHNHRSRRTSAWSGLAYS